jgi:hypothetical protein
MTSTIKWLDKNQIGHKTNTTADVFIRKCNTKAKTIRYSIRLSKRACQRIWRGDYPEWLRIGMADGSLFFMAGTELNGYKMRDQNKTDGACGCAVSFDLSNLEGAHRLVWDDRAGALRVTDEVDK